MFHANQVMHGTGDSDGNIDCRTDGLSGQTYLAGIRQQAVVHRFPGGGKFPADFIGKGFDDIKAFRSTETGSHDELIEKGGMYAQLYATQTNIARQM